MRKLRLPRRFSGSCADFLKGNDVSFNMHVLYSYGSNPLKDSSLLQSSFLCENLLSKEGMIWKKNILKKMITWRRLPRSSATKTCKKTSVSFGALRPVKFFKFYYVHFLQSILTGIFWRYSKDSRPWLGDKLKMESYVRSDMEDWLFPDNQMIIIFKDQKGMIDLCRTQFLGTPRTLQTS